MTEEQKQKANNARNAYRKVSTPEGEFNSIIAAAKHYKVSTVCIRRYCEVGEHQRELGRVAINAWQKNDYRDWVWEKQTAERKFSSKKVKTPFGVFDSCKAAADAEGITPPALAHKLRNNPDYEYL